MPQKSILFKTVILIGIIYAGLVLILLKKEMFYIGMKTYLSYGSLNIGNLLMGKLKVTRKSSFKILGYELKFLHAPGTDLFY